jgi:hypothetical protein
MKTVQFFCLILLWVGAPIRAEDPYQLLGVSPQASEEEITQAYRRKAKETHPDVSSLPPEQAQEAFKRIQTAWEQIKRAKTLGPSRSESTDAYHQRKEQEKKEAQVKATAILEKDWADGLFGSTTLDKLPQLSGAATRRGNFPGVAHGPKEDGEWEAVRTFLNNKQDEFLRRNPTPADISDLLTRLDGYTDLTGQAVKDIRGGITHSLEQYIFENTNDRELFLDTLRSRIERLSRAGAFVQSTNPTEERKKALGKAPELYFEKFNLAKGEVGSPAFQLSKELMQSTFTQVKQSPSKIHELGALLRGLPPLLNSEEKLLFLGDFMENLDSISNQHNRSPVYKDLVNRAEKLIERVFQSNPELRTYYAGKNSFWNRITSQGTRCERILGKIARNWKNSH